MKKKESPCGSLKLTLAETTFGAAVQELCTQYNLTNGLLHGQYSIPARALPRLFSGCGYTLHNVECFVVALAEVVMERRPKDDPHYRPDLDPLSAAERQQLLADTIHALYTIHERDTLAALHLPTPTPDHP